MAVQTPQGASLQYTQQVCSKVEEVISHVPEINGAFTIVGFSFRGNASNRALMFLNLAEFKDRKGREHSSFAVVEKLRGPLMGIPGGIAVPFNPPAVEGLGQFGGFTFELEDLGRNTLQTLANTANQMVASGNQSDQVTGLFTSFTANDPQYLVKIDREKAKSLQIPLSQITDALQVFMGSVYVNDFDFNNRSYRVYLQADQKFRSEAKDIRTYYLRSDTRQNDSSRQCRGDQAGGESAGHHALQSVPLGRNQWFRGAAREFRPSPRGDGRNCEESPAARYDVRMERPVAGRNPICGQSGHFVWAWAWYSST